MPASEGGMISPHSMPTKLPARYDSSTHERNLMFNMIDVLDIGDLTIYLFSPFLPTC